MAYKNPFWYNRDYSVDNIYYYQGDLIGYKPIYGSSVSYSSRLNVSETTDNSLKILPSSENNLVIKYNLKFLLIDFELGHLLKTIENAGATKYLKFSDPSNCYKEILGLVEDYSVNKNSQNLNELNITVSSYFKAPIFNWKTSSILYTDQYSIKYSSNEYYKKYQFTYFNPNDNNASYLGEKNKIDNFWFAKQDIEPTKDSKFDTTKWTKVFNHDSKIPFELKNKLDIYQMNYKNSFVQNIKYKNNSNSLSEFTFKLENISDYQCRSILFFLEKKCGYRRFIYYFPFLLKKHKVFICTQWNHNMKYFNCNDITATFIEDPNPEMNMFKFIDSDYYSEFNIDNPYPTLLNSYS